MSARETLEVPGLDGPVEIAIDRWGIAHIRAGSTADVFFAQGFNAARDRLYQLDIGRKRGLGQLAADLGPGFLEQDIASRAFLYRGDMAAEYAAYGPDTEAICTAFTAGINACIALTEAEPERLPPEFALLGTRPARWEARDVLRIRSHARSNNLVSEITRAAILAKADLATDALRKPLSPPREPDRRIDPARVPLAAAMRFRLAQASVTISPERLAAPLAEAPRWSSVNDLAEVLRTEASDGSNNWAISRERSATGRPILASDPHRAHSLPGLRYIVHLTCPAFDVIGAGEPCLPGISLGHNGTAAFGLTIFGGDQEDAFLHDLHPDDTDLYRFGEGWERFEVVEERFAVKGEADQILPLRLSRFGPVVHHDPAGRIAVSVRTVWQGPGANAYAASLATMRATDYAGFAQELGRWGCPSINMVYADTAGTIAWLPAGHVPERPNWDGLLPVPGDGSHDWAGLRDPALLPRRVNPPCGYVFSANEPNLPADWPHETLRIGHEWIEPSRAMRIREVLSQPGLHDLAASCALQTDVMSMPARRLMALLAPAAPLCATPAPALLAGWDCALTAESGAAALFEVWFTRHLKPGLFALLAPDPAVRALLAPGDVGAILTALEAPDSRFGEEPPAARDRLLARTLDAAFADCAARMGDDPASWQWGRLHHGYFTHPLAGLLPEGERNRYDVGPYPKGGSGSTPMHTGYRPADFRIMHGASVRLVMDVGAWDNSLCINAPGQSGDPRDPHYADLAPLWAGGAYVPLTYSAAAVDAVTERTLVLHTGDRRTTV